MKPLDIETEAEAAALKVHPYRYRESDKMDAYKARTQYKAGYIAGYQAALESSPVNPLLSPLREAIEALKEAAKRAWGTEYSKFSSDDAHAKDFADPFYVRCMEVINKSSKLINE